MDSAHWDERYAGKELVWSAGPNVFVADLTADLPPGAVLDLAAGEGRNALWLAERGWRATAVDFSRVALDRAEALARERDIRPPGSFTTVHADLLDYVPPARSYDLVLVAYLQVPAAERRLVLRRAAEAVAAGGTLLVVAHDSDNLAHGTGGPQDPTVLYTAADVVADIAGTGLEVSRAEPVRRVVPADDGDREAIDALLLARRPVAGR